MLNLTGADGTVGTFTYADYFSNGHFLPIFFVTVACGILSGFHSTQTAIISRTMKSERQGRNTFYNMMVLEGFIAMVWAAGAMGVYNLALQEPNASLATGTVGVVCKFLLGHVGGIIALIGVIVLPITSGDTALRALRLSLSETLHIDQSTNGKRIKLAVPIFILVIAILVFAKTNSDGFNDPVALLRMGQPDAVPVCLPEHHRVDVRERQGQVGLDAHDPRLLLHLHLRRPTSPTHTSASTSPGRPPTSSAWCVLRLTLWAAACTARSVLPSCWPSKTRSSSVGKYERTSTRDGSRRPLCFPGNAFSGLTEHNRRSANLTCQVMRCV